MSWWWRGMNGLLNSTHAREHSTDGGEQRRRCRDGVTGGPRLGKAGVRAREAPCDRISMTNTQEGRRRLTSTVVRRLAVLRDAVMLSSAALLVHGPLSLTQAACRHHLGSTTSTGVVKKLGWGSPRTTAPIQPRRAVMPGSAALHAPYVLGQHQPEASTHPNRGSQAAFFLAARSVGLRSNTRSTSAAVHRPLAPLRGSLSTSWPSRNSTTVGSCDDVALRSMP
jgi:hypothetical protein